MSYTASDDYEGTGEVLLAFLDEDGCRVTIRLRPSALEQLMARIQAAPDRA